ncbi:GroES-like protein [Microthyrium microscopicum]|uniref:GroES-like protein n=1 Tax=Microthyrium microscopicum TaxID=703497 RepID=A0A6A6UJA7_9PEZI|nr:GroES-like protein [Microthyrium microscopicum]
MSNKAAWYTEVKGRPFKVDDAPIPEPKANKIVIRNHAIAINPVDAAIQRLGMLVTEDQLPNILGFDVSGDIVSVGSKVTNFKTGDQVLAMPSSFPANLPRTGTFQLYVVSNTVIVSKNPDSVTYTQASVLPLCMMVAAIRLYSKDTFDLPLPQLNPSPLNKVLLAWGGSSSVGSCAIQGAKAAGKISQGQTTRLDDMR